MLRLAPGKRALLTFLACLTFACSRSPQPAEVTIRLEEPTASLASATILVDYSQAAASPLTRGGDPACTSIAPNVSAEFGDDRQGHLTINAEAAGGFSPPIDLAVCRMVPETTSATATAIAARLRISLLNATDTAGVALDDRQLASSRSSGRRIAAASTDGTGGDTARAAGSTGAAGSATGSGAAPSAGSAASGRTADTGTASPPATAGTRTGGMGASPEVGRRLIPPDRTAAARSPGSPSSPGAPGADGDGGGDDGGDQALGKADSNEDTDTDRSATAYVVTIGVTSQGKLGALQFNLQHHGTSGGFAGAGASARCQNTGAAASALASFNDVGNGVLRAGFIDLNGFDTPGAVATCTFKSRDSVTASDFSIEVVDATDPELKPQNVAVAVMDLRAQ